MIDPGRVPFPRHGLEATAASELAQQTLESSASKALTGISLAREYLSHGFTTLRDLGCMDPEFPTVDLRNALQARVAQGPRLIVVAHIISASGGHGDPSGFQSNRHHSAS